MDWQVLGNALLIFVLRVTDVSIATVRTILIIRGKRGASAALGFVQATIFVLAVGRAVQDIGNLWNVLGYAGGFAVGTLVGMWIEEKLALGYVHVRVFARKRGRELASLLRDAGYGVTETLSEGLEGYVDTIDILVQRKVLPQLLAQIREHNPAAMVTVEETRSVYRGHMPRLGRNGG
ncbi:MAG TPA: DUF2179 domain-containing protein [Chloroflexi bacterium]|nr:DUF2179 domain-containing protein [Chloroflexota bacterium]